MPISPKKPLTLEQIAFLWSRELGPYSPRQKQTITESSPVELLEELIAAFRLGDLLSVDLIAEPARDALKRSRHHFVLEYDDGRSWVPPKRGSLRVGSVSCLEHDILDTGDNEGSPCTDECRADENLILNTPSLFVAREDFLGWAAEQGYPRPRFWDGEVWKQGQASASAPANPPGPAEKTTIKKNPRGRVPVQTPKAEANLRAALAANPTLRDNPPIEKELARLAGGVSRDIARKAWAKILSE